MNQAFTAAEQQELESRMNQKQMIAGVTGMMKVVERCFNHCIDDFTSKSLTSREESCVNKCAEKFNNGMARIALRFQEANEVAMKTGSMSGI